MIKELLQTDLYELLLKSKAEQKFFFESKDKSVTILALGPSELIAYNQAANFLKKYPDLILWSAMFFENTDMSVFHASALTLIERDGKISLLINPNLDCNLTELFNAQDPTYFNHQSTVQFNPDFKNWKLMINHALDLLHENKLLKIVLKRKQIIQYKNTICPLSIFQKVYSKESANYNIYVQENAQKAFISFTPEKLFSLSDSNTIETISLAGSVPRGKTAEEDLFYENELLSSAKLIQEQKIVTDEITSRLSHFAQEIIVSDLEVIKLRYIQHRSNIIKAKLNNDCDFLDLIGTLHPTPAVGGAPNELAQSAISLLEQDQRKNYAAPIGFATGNYSEWAVGLRSASIDSNTLTIYAGCGIVSGSIPEVEWDETEVKMRPFINALEPGQVHV